MRIVPSSNKEFLIITRENEVCAFVGRKPEPANPLHSAAPRRVTIADSIVAKYAEFAASLHRASAGRR
jgi:hypothetical protein